MRFRLSRKGNINVRGKRVWLTGEASNQTTEGADPHSMWPGGTERRYLFEATGHGRLYCAGRDPVGQDAVIPAVSPRIDSAGSTLIPQHGANERTNGECTEHGGRLVVLNPHLGHLQREIPPFES